MLIAPRVRHQIRAIEWNQPQDRYQLWYWFDNLGKNYPTDTFPTNSLGSSPNRIDHACGISVRLRTVRSVLNRAIQGGEGVLIETSERAPMPQKSVNGARLPVASSFCRVNTTTGKLFATP